MVASAVMEHPASASAPASKAPVPSDGRAITTSTLLDIENLDFFYGQTQALNGINLKIENNKVTAFIGPSGCGKSTLLRCINRMNDLIEGTRVARGSIRIHGVEIY